MSSDIWRLFISRRYDSASSAGQSAGGGVIEKNVFWPTSSGPGESSIAPPNERMNSGVQSISSGSSTRVMIECSRQNASTRTSSSRLYDTSSSAAG